MAAHARLRLTLSMLFALLLGLLAVASPALADEAAPEVYETSMEPWAVSAVADDGTSLKAYDDAYRVRYDGSNVAVTQGNYGGNIARHVAEDNTAFWEPNWYNVGNDIHIDVTFDQPRDFQWVVYGSRTDASLKGFATEFELYISSDPTGNNWQKVTHGYGSTTSSLCAFDACPEGQTLTARRVRFQFISSNGNYPSCRQLRFYQQDPNEHLLDNVWSNYSETELRDGFSIADAQSTIDTLKASPSYAAVYQPLVSRLERITSGDLTFDQSLELSNEADVDADSRSTKAIKRVGDVAGYARNTLKFSNGATNRQVTGIWYPANETIRIWVYRENDADPLPKVRWAQPYGYWASWQGGTTQLVEGENVITVPNYKTTDYKTYDIVAGCAAYLENPYTEDQQRGLVKVYFEGGRHFPVYRLGDPIEPYMEELRAHADRVREDPTSEMDVTEIVSNHVMMTVQATRADEMYGARGHNAQEALECWDTTIHRCLEFEGITFDEGGEHYDPRNDYLNENFRVSQVWDLGWMFTAGEHIGVYDDPSAQDVLIDPIDQYGQSRIAPNWGLIHEWGHSIDIPARTIQETTNNMPAYFESTFCPEFVRNAEDIARANRMGAAGYVAGSMFAENRYNFMPFWLVEAYWPGWWGRVENLYRYMDVDAAHGFNDKGQDTLAKTERMVLNASIAAGYDLRYWFERWGLNIDSVNEKPFTVAGASLAFEEQFQKAVGEGQISTTLDGFDAEPEGEGWQLPLWFLDRAEYGLAKAAGDGSALTLYDADDKPTIKSVSKGTKTVVNEDKSTETVPVYSVAIEKSTEANHLVYLVERRPVGGGDASWEYVGYTYGGIYADPIEGAGSAPVEYRIRALDRSLHSSGYSDAVGVAEAGVVARYANSGEGVASPASADAGKTEFESLAEAVENAAAGTTIEILADCTGEGIPVTQSLTLVPADKAVTISRSGDGPIFELKGTGALTIAKNGELTLAFDGNYANGTAPGIRVDNNATLTADGATFRHFVNAADGNPGQGGAINVVSSGAKAILSSCTFEANGALDGGAIASRGTTRLTGCTLTGNTARDEGGAIRNYSGGILYLDQCTIEGNTGVYGGGISLEGLTYARGCTITGNSAKFGGGVDARLGNRQAYFDDLDGVRTVVEDNRASAAGDALYIGSNVASTVYLADAEFRAAESGPDEPARTAVRIDQGQLVLNADLDNCPARSYVTGFNTDSEGGSVVEGVIFEGGTSLVTMNDEWTAEPLAFEIDDLGRSQPVVRTYDFTGEDFEGHVSLANADGAELQWESAESRTDQGVYVASGGDVILELNGGTVQGDDVTSYVKGATTYLPTSVTRQGYSFVGWFDNPGFTGASVRSIPATAEGPQRFWAKWSDGNYWINYRLNGGKLPAGTPDHRKFGTSVVLATPTRDGFTFEGWYTKSDFSGEPVSIIDPNAEGTFTVYAKWSHGADKGTVLEMMPATCTMPGYKLIGYKCVDCKEELETVWEEIPATGHDFGEWTAIEAPSGGDGADGSASCFQEGAEQRECKTCGYIETRGLGDAGHAWRDWEVVDGKAATCVKDGLQSRECANCGVREYQVIPATGHKVDQPTPSVTERNASADGEVGDGLTQNGAGDGPEIFNESYQDGQQAQTPNGPDSEPTGNDGLDVEHVEPTCTEPGHIIVRAQCSVCQETFVLSYDKLSALGHEFANGICETCGAKEPDPATDPDDEPQGDPDQSVGEQQGDPGNSNDPGLDEEVVTPGTSTPSKDTNPNPDSTTSETTDNQAGDQRDSSEDQNPAIPTTDNEAAKPETGQPDNNQPDSTAPEGNQPADDPTDVPIVDTKEHTDGTTTPVSSDNNSEPAPATPVNAVPKTGDDTPWPAIAATLLLALASATTGLYLLFRKQN